MTQVPNFFCFSVPLGIFYRFVCTPKNEEIEKKKVVESGWRLHHVFYKCTTWGTRAPDWEPLLQGYTVIYKNAKEVQKIKKIGNL